MKFSPFYLLLATTLACSAIDLPPPAVNSVAFDSTVDVWSSHTTVRERVDAGLNERIELWGRTWIVSPSGQTYANTDHWGFNAPDGYAATTITLSETGRWSYWISDGGSLDSFVYGDGPSDWYIWPHNAPNGVGYGGWGRRISAYFDVQPAPPTNVPPTISWNGTPGGVASGQSYTISAHGHDSDGNLAQVNVWKNGAPFAFAGGGDGTDGDSGNATSDTGPATVTFTAQAVDSAGATSATISQTVTVSAPPPVNHPPTISWNTTPGTVASGQSYTVSAHGYDQDGNLTQVNVWKDGAPFAFAGGGNGTDNDSGNSTADSGPTTITFTAQAVDSDGATSATISQTVTISAPPPVNHPPTISWNTTPGTVANGQSYTVSAHGHDPDGNLTQVNVWKDGIPFAFSGGGNGADNDSGNPTSDTGPATVTFTALAVDSDGATSATISQTVTISAPPPINHPPTISWNSTAPGTVASGQTYTISAHGHDPDGNLTQVNVWKDGVPFAFAGGGNGTDNDSTNATGDPGPTTITFTAQAFDSTGASSAVISLIVTVATPNHPPTIAWNTMPGAVPSGQSYMVSAHGHDQDGNLTQVNVWKDGVPFAFAGGGNGMDSDSANATNDPGPAIITFTAQAVDSDGATSATISQTVMVSAPPPINHPPTINWNTTPGTIASGQSYTISAHGHDQDGNLTQVNIWKNGAPFTFAGGGNGTDGDATNSSSDFSPPSIIYTAQAVDATGATSATISQTVTISGPPPINFPPMISWTSTPGTVAGGQAYTISAHGHDPDGNLTQVNIWKNGAPFTSASGGNGTDGDASNPSTDFGPPSITYTAQAVDAMGATSPIISQTVTISGPPTVNHPPTISWTATPGTVAGGQTYTISAHGHDQDGNLTQVNIWKNGAPFTSASGGNGTDADAANSSTDLVGPPFVAYTAQAVDAMGATSAMISQTVTIAPPPPTQYTLNTSAGAGGGVSPGGTYNAGTAVNITAMPDPMHDFAGWSGDALGGANPVSVTLDRNKSVQANFTLKTFALTMTTTGGGSVTPGGSYPTGTIVTITATPDATHRFTGWTGDASGTATTIAVTLDRAKFVQANFTGKTAQTILFDPPGDHALTSPPLTLTASATSGLPVIFSLLGGPATLTGNSVQVTGAGPVTLQANQPGDAFFLPATPANRTFNVIAAATLKYRGQSRTLLRDKNTHEAPPYVLEKP